MIGWLLNSVYVLLLVLVSPVLLCRAFTQGKYRTGWSQKLFGRLPVSHADEKVIWLHAVSVGEVLQLRTLVPELQRRHPETSVLITTTTVTGHAVAVETFPDCRVAYCPLDFTWAVRTALQRVQPVLVCLVELELWPNLIRETAAAGVPLMLINGRMSERSYRGYRRLRSFMRSLLSRFDTLAVQTDEYADRLRNLGAPVDRVHVTGSIKFDGVDATRSLDAIDDLRNRFGITNIETVFVAGSTHAPEEMIVLDTWEQLRTDFPGLRLVLVPRHRERFDDVAALVESRGHTLIRGSQSSQAQPASSDAVCLLDTLGELPACWGLADVAFVGGSLTSRGGQNMIEPAAYGVPVIVGPNTSNFRDVVEGLTTAGGIYVTQDERELASSLRTLLNDQSARHRLGQAARAFILSQQGATQRTLGLIDQMLPQASSSTDQAA